LRLSRVFSVLATVVLCCGASANAAAPDHWVGTWAAAPMAAKNPGGKLGGEGTEGTTLRQIVHVSIGGSSLRVVLTNEFGEDPLTVSAAQIALSAGGGGIVAGSSIQLSFSGRTSVVIPPGALVVSDAAEIKVTPLSDVAVSLFVPDQPVSVISVHNSATATSYMVPGNAVTETTLTEAKPFYHWYFLKGLDVLGDAASAAVVAYGDSITDGAHSTRDKNTRWPDVLAARLVANKKTAKIGVLNEGISGNRVLHDNAGPSALARFDRDVLSQDGVKYLIILEAINDIGHAYDPKKPYDLVSADDLIAGYVQMIERAHAHGIKVFGATLTPYGGAGYESPAGEDVRQSVNKWIRTSGKFDGVVDFDKATLDPKNPAAMLPAYNVLGTTVPDHLHPNDDGYKVMGDSIDLGLFGK
jgi:lysophospholipase L1-like esterase